MVPQPRTEATAPLWNRRHWLAGAAAVTGALMTRSAPASVIDPTEGWVDSHVHVWTNDLISYPIIDRFKPEDMVPATFPPTELLRHAATGGVSRIVLVQMSYYGTDNRYMLEAMRTAPGTFGGIGIVDEADDPAAAMRRLAAQGVRGFRIVPRDNTPEQWLRSEGAAAMWRCATEEGLAMCALINPPHLHSLARMLKDFPDTPVVIDHFARVGIDGRIRADELDLLCSLARWKGVHVKISAYYALGAKQGPYTDLIPMIRKVIDAYGPERCMWGSDAPYQVMEGHTYADSIALLTDRMELTAHERECVLRGTATRLFF